MAKASSYGNPRVLEELVNYPIDEHTRIVEVSRDFNSFKTIVKARNFALDRQSVFAIDDASLMYYPDNVKDIIIEKFRRSDLCRPDVFHSEVVPDVSIETNSNKVESNIEWLKRRVNEIRECWKN